MTTLSNWGGPRIGLTVQIEWKAAIGVAAVLRILPDFAAFCRAKRLI